MVYIFLIWILWYFSLEGDTSTAGSSTGRYDESFSNEQEIVNITRDIPRGPRRGAISAEVYHDEEIKNFSRKVIV